MMDLILWRHAEAEEAQDGGDDLARPLTPRARSRQRGWPLGWIGSCRRA